MQKIEKEREMWQEEGLEKMQEDMWNMLKRGQTAFGSMTASNNFSTVLARFYLPLFYLFLHGLSDFTQGLHIFKQIYRGSVVEQFYVLQYI